jgi:protease-4
VKQSRKPIVVSIGDVGASGAYMVASQADKIFANPGSAVGSIGVITEIPNVNGLLDKLGVKFTVVKAGKLKDTGSPYRALTPTETALIQGSVDQVYGQFIDIVAEGRNMPRSKVESLATGWAWNGEEAKRLGLVDEIGTYRDALAAAAKLGGIQGRYDVVTYDNRQFEQLLNSILGISRQLDPLGALGPRGTTTPGPAVPR